MSAGLPSRATQFSYLNRDQASTVNSVLSRFQESGTGEIKPSAPMELDTPWKVEAVFELDPLVNVPGPSAMTLPIGVAPGRIRGMANRKPPGVRRFPAACDSVRHSESITLAFPASVQVQRIPDDVRFKRGPIEYRASYRLEGQLLKADRDYVVRRASPICGVQDDRDWTAFREVIQRDMRAQVFFK